MTERLINGYLIDVEKYQGQDDSGFLYTGWRYSVQNPDRQIVGIGDGFDTNQQAKDAATRTALLCAMRARQEVTQ